MTMSRTANPERSFDLVRFAREHFFSSWFQLLWLIALTWVTVVVVASQLRSAPLLTALIVVASIASVGLTLYNESRHSHSALTRWLKENLYSSASNILISLLLTVLIVAALRGFIDYAFLRASFSADSVTAKANIAAISEQGGEPGANWGGVIANFRNLMLYRYPQDLTWRIIAIPLILLALSAPSWFVYRNEALRRSNTRRLLNIVWLLVPIVAFMLIYGFSSSGPLRQVRPDGVWGGLLLSLIISFFAIVASFPLGLLLALGRRSEIRGIPGWALAILTALATGWGLWRSTPTLLANAQGTLSSLVAFWPLLIPLAAWLFQRSFKGNVVAAFSTAYIEMVRGVPLITVLFMSIILFPIFLPPGTEIFNTWRVMVAAALFAAAYLAENVRGGLQSLSRGQYEAADSIGLNTFQKYRLIILPQALRAVIPALVGQFIALFLDTTLVAIVGLTDLLGAANLISAQPDWLGVRREPLIFIAIIYFVGSYLMASYSRRLETRLGVGQR
jgi:general L-amino acid transport system permease protein